MKKELSAVKGEVELLRTMLSAAQQKLQEQSSGSGSSGYVTLGDDSQYGGNTTATQSNESVARNVRILWPFELLLWNHGGVVGFSVTVKVIKWTVVSRAAATVILLRADIVVFVPK